VFEILVWSSAVLSTCCRCMVSTWVPNMR